MSFARAIRTSQVIGIVAVHAHVYQYAAVPAGIGAERKNPLVIVIKTVRQHVNMLALHLILEMYK